MEIIKKEVKDIKFETIEEGLWKNSNLAQIFDTSGKTNMSAGIHELFACEIVVEEAPVDDVLYILEGEIEIECNGKTTIFRAGDFAYMYAGHKQKFIVKNRVKHLYVTYPANWE